MAVEGLIKAQMNPKQKLACPAERTVGGARFRDGGTARRRDAEPSGQLRQGCVTALASLARKIDGADLATSAAQFGIGAPWTLPLKSFSGSMKPLTSDAATAKAIAGQNVLVSPLSMALVAGAVASGTWRPPVLVTDPKTPDPSVEAAPSKAPDPIKIDDKTVETLAHLHALRSGRGLRPCRRGPGDPVHGITAVATRDRKPLAWFVGWQGDVAVAVLTASEDPGGGCRRGRFFRGPHDKL